MDADFLLIQKMKQGDDQAVEAFVRKYYPKILQYCHFHIDDAGYAEDMAQETFENFFRTFHRYRHYGKAANYLYVIAANACRDYHRKSLGLSCELSLEKTPEPAGCCMDGLETRIDVRRAFNTLPRELKETAILFFCLEVRQKEIAMILGIGLPLVKYRIKRARELISSQLGKEEMPNEVSR